MGSVLTLQHKIQCSTIVSKLPFGNLLLIKCSPNIRYFVDRKINYEMKGQTEITETAAEPVSQSLQSNPGHVRQLKAYYYTYRLQEG